MKNFTRLALGAATAAVTWCAGVAHAQQTVQSQQGLQAMGGDASLGVAYLPQKSNLSDTGGTKLSESAVLHVGLGFEAGYDTNVFYVKNDPTSAPVIRVIPFVQLTNAARGGAQPGGAFYDLSASLLYREFITDNTSAKAQRAFNPVISGLLDLNPQSPLNFSITDQFARFEEPPYGAGTGNITRIYNLGSLQLKYAPGGGRLQTMLRYSNSINVFETDYLKYANHMGHDLTLDAGWRWLPKTALFVQASQGYIDYFNPNEPNSPRRRNSYPLRVVAGLRGLITNKINLYLGVGYLNGFYTGGVQNTSGFSNLGVVTELSYAPTILTKMMIGYRREFRNSPVLGNFYDVDTPYGSVAVNLASRFVVSAFAKYEYRRYRGLTVDRKDNVFQSGTQADFFVAHWFYLGASYIVTVNDSNLDNTLVGAPAGAPPGTPASTPAGLDYVKHLVLARLGVTY